MTRFNNNLEKDSELATNCKRAIRTTFIGAISQFERSFGYLWGHNKPKEELTENQKKFLELWLQTRKNILDCGNEQSRIINNEFEKYIVKYNGYQYKFKVVPRNQLPPNTRYDSENNVYIIDTKGKNGNV